MSRGYGGGSLCVNKLTGQRDTTWQMFDTYQSIVRIPCSIVKDKHVLISLLSRWPRVAGAWLDGTHVKRCDAPKLRHAIGSEGQINPCYLPDAS